MPLAGQMTSQCSALYRLLLLQAQHVPSQPTVSKILQASQVAAQDAEKKAAAFEGVSIEVRRKLLQRAGVSIPATLRQ